VRHLNKSMFNGKLSEDEMAHEHPAELAEIRAGSADPFPPPDVLRRRQRRFFPIAAVLAVIFGLSLYGFVTIETTAITTVPPGETAQVYVPLTPTPRPSPTPAPTPIPGEGVAANSWDGSISALFRNRQHLPRNHKVGGLSLATYEDALAGGNSGPGIVPGNAEQSMVVQVQQKGGHPGQLTEQELQQVIEWIEAGAAEK
jgi:hypothetical protein